MKRIIHYIYIFFAVTSISLLLQNCNKDTDYTLEYSTNTLASSIMTRAGEVSNFLVSVQDSIVYPFEIELSSLNVGTYKNTYKSTVYVIFYHDKSSYAPGVSLINYYAPTNHSISGVSIEKDMFAGRYKLSASGKDDKGIDCSGTYKYPIFIADYKPESNIEEEDSTEQARHP